MDYDYNQKYKVVYEVVKKWIYEKGTKFSKKHGNWIVLYAPKNQVFVMDTWNGHIEQAHCTESLIDDGYASGRRSAHTYVSPMKYKHTKDDLEEIVDMYKTLLTIPTFTN